MVPRVVRCLRAAAIAPAGELGCVDDKSVFFVRRELAVIAK